MARFGQQDNDPTRANVLDISPLIDCVFILLIFFIVTTTFVEEPGVEIDRPAAMSAEQLPKSSILIAVTQNGEVVYGGRDIGVGGVRPLVRRMIQKQDVPVIIQADGRSPSNLVIRVVDQAKLAGAARVNLATRDVAG
jgi:biopolymer transport protein ExbD